MAYGYKCPQCRTENAAHSPGCKFASLADGKIEEAHVDIISSLAMSRHSEDELKDEAPNNWLAIHDAVLDLYLSEGRITHEMRENEDKPDEEVLRLLTPDEYRAQLSPTHENIKVVWENGPVDGVKDVSVTAIVSWHEMKDFSWEETRQRTIDWLRDTGAWGRGSWEESSPAEVVDAKKHVHDRGYGWANAASEAAGSIKNQMGATA
ncbi:DUF7474 family protein [Halococcus saccharolyticus]|uniref:Uncharacterized protein n=1 Tax=Halococcus saccharolyticus DSM 5350 TaxID=1227455 RepID=M0MPR2_9EURY|nr:hypothetical protein [Halococcus saccharolyticus]EMA47626.1 hypothetical protein C449_01147 [Halococcus saccharolyticus DSM 5350]